MQPPHELPQFELELHVRWFPDFAFDALCASDKLFDEHDAFSDAEAAEYVFSEFAGHELTLQADFEFALQFLLTVLDCLLHDDAAGILPSSTPHCELATADVNAAFTDLTASAGVLVHVATETLALLPIASARMSAITFFFT